MKVWMWHWRPQANEKEHSSLCDLEDERKQHLHRTVLLADLLWFAVFFQSAHFDHLG